MAKKTAAYGDSSIVSLKGADRVRKRPAVIFGSDGVSGCEHSFFEILSNSIDEARQGYGNVINVTRFADKSIQVEDFGRGCPVDWNEKEGRYNWELVYCELYAGGKYANGEDGNYEFSLGLNGLGACATQYSSEFMDVTCYYDKTMYSLHFERGENKTDAPNKLSKTPYSGRRTGTVHRWRPDIQVFTDIDIPLEYYIDTLKKQAVVNAGLKFVLLDEQPDGSFVSTEYCYTNGISDYVTELAGLDAIVPVRYSSGERKGRDRADKPEYKVRMQAAFTLTPATSSITFFHNSSWLEYGGAPDKATRNAFTAALDGYLRQKGKYGKSDSKIVYQDIADSLVLVTSSFSTVTSYENQTKKAITNKFIQEAMTDFLKSMLEAFFQECPAEAEKVAERVIRNKQIRESADQARQSARKKLSAPMDISSRVEKFVDCRTKDVSRRELYIVEGDSALGSVVQGRNSEFQAVMPVRGKILNCLKANYNRIFQSDIIVDLMKVLGCGVEVKHSCKELPAFDINQLRWNKVIICTDADVDGFQIRVLVLTMLYRLVPTLIQQGYVYIAESPLYEINCGDDTYFAYDEKEKATILADLDGKKVNIQRSKGLGENEPEMMSLTTMSPATRRLIQVTPDDATATAETFDLFPGDNLAGRKEYIVQYGAEWLELADLF